MPGNKSDQTPSSDTSSVSLLLKNTALLYILQFSAIFFNLLTIPYQTRILGPTIFGLLAFALSITLLIQVIIDFGFNLFATAEISKNRDDLKKVQNIYTSVFHIKLFMSLVAMLILLVTCSLVPVVNNHAMLYVLFLGAAIMQALLPDYIYRGMEMMSYITVRSVAIRSFFAVMVFVFLKSPDDYLVVPLLLLIGNCLSFIIASYHINKAFGLKLNTLKFNARHTIMTLKSASPFFVSRVATSIYSAGNTFVLGISGMTSAVGLYSSVDKIFMAVRSIASPIADSLYPHTIQSRDWKIVKKILLWSIIPIIIFGIVSSIYAEDICSILFGKQFSEAADILRALTPALMLCLPNYLLGYPTLGAFNATRYANISVVAGTAVQVTLLGLLALYGQINAKSIGLITSVTESAVFVYRSNAVYRLSRKKIPEGEQ